MKKIILWAVIAGCLCGCVSFEYEGVKEPTSTKAVRVYTDSAKITRAYTVLGRASASGNYMDVSKERLQEKLVSEAEKCGANAILITSQQIVPYKQKNANPAFNSAFDYDDESSSWRQLYRDFDLTYGSAKGTPNDNSNVTLYRRILRAEFLKYTQEPAPATAEDHQK